MKWFKRLGVLLLLLLVFRGPIFRTLIKYEVVGQRNLQTITDEELLSEIREAKIDGACSLEDIASTADLLTRSALGFVASSEPTDPNEVYRSGEANCVGYAALFGAVAATLIDMHGRCDACRETP